MCLMTSEQHLARAAQLREANPNSRAAALHEMIARTLGQESETDKLADEYRDRLAQDDNPTPAEARRQAIVTAGGEVDDKRGRKRR
jgi:hypothetical protein